MESISLNRRVETFLTGVRDGDSKLSRLRNRVVVNARIGDLDVPLQLTQFALRYDDEVTWAQCNQFLAAPWFFERSVIDQLSLSDRVVYAMNEENLSMLRCDLEASGHRKAVDRRQ